MKPPLISLSTLDAVKVGVLTNDQLKEAIAHYDPLVLLLACHGEKYHLVWKDAFMKLQELYGYMNSRKLHGKWIED